MNKVENNEQIINLNETEQTNKQNPKQTKNPTNLVTIPQNSSYNMRKQLRGCSLKFVQTLLGNKVENIL